MFIITAGDKGKNPNLFLTYKSKTAANKRADKLRKLFDDVRIVETDTNVYKYSLDIWQPNH